MGQPDHPGDDAAFLRDGGATGALIATFDWASTSLGPLSAWPQSLRTATAIVLRSRTPMALLWGEEGVMIYNDGYAEIAGSRHPDLLGSKVAEAWPEGVEFNEQVLRTVLTGATLNYRDQPLELRRSGVLETLWFDLDYSPVPDEAGRPAGVLAVVVETTQRVLAERRDAANAERQRQMLEQAPGFICLLSGPDHVFEFRNEAHKRLFGEREPIARSHSEVFADLPDPGFVELLDHVYATGKRHVARARPVNLRDRPDGPLEQHLLDFVLQPVSNEQGEVSGIFVEGFDVTEQARAQAAAEESGQRLSAAIAIARLGAICWDRETREATLDERAREIFGFEPDAIVTIDDVILRIAPKDLARIGVGTTPDWSESPRQEREFRIHLPNGVERDIVSVSVLSPGPHGPNTRAVGLFRDVTEMRAAEQRQRMLINELNHRVKNSLATVQSIAAQTLRSAPDLLSARIALEARLVALAAAHDILTAESWHGARLIEVIAAAMGPFETLQRPQISRSGPPVWLAAQPALALSLALHELATNAVKYGALSRPEGRVTIRWNLVGDMLTITWREDGGPPVRAPVRSGFGSRLLQRSLARDLHGEVVVAFAPEGVVCEIRCRPSALQAARGFIDA
ncbi:PAS domain-containing sensor histidine kinase [Phenylobacterium sp.]|uniref:PAS domain-containing sensor histidine kinase n=1 Tax=Phenylobacterium sp. TaxID=1871053 RepID=UPI002FC6BF59